MQEPPLSEVPSTLPLGPPGPSQAAGGPPRMIGRYTIIREVARGGMGAVLLAWDPHLRVQRAIKVLLADVCFVARSTDHTNARTARFENVEVLVEAPLRGAVSGR